MKLKFYKMHGLGNDFAIFDQRENNHEFTKEQIISLADRRLGIGCDQFIILKSCETADVQMQIYNPDASRAEACGNAMRCIAKLLGQPKSSIKVNERLLSAEILNDGNVRVNMGQPSYDWQQIPLKSEIYPINMRFENVANDFEHGHAVSMGNPHLVFFVSDLKELDITANGSYFENHQYFPNRTNVNFAQIINDGEINLTTWERGTGQTPACGSGACATQAIAHAIGHTKNKAKINLQHGSLIIEVLPDGIYMTGNSTLVFTGEIIL
ncbi:MAG: diaminopimelate epimerase [Rickettsiales bacterium]